MPFLPVSRKDMDRLGISRLDFVYVIGDAYVDHSSFGPAIISRILERNGYTVGIISQPDWKSEESIRVLGEPRLAFLVSSGNMDSMVNHYTVAKKHRKTDSYSPGGRMGLRPDRADIVYGNLIRKSYKHTPIILGGIEASLRRLAHYDYWADCIKRSVLLDSCADMISYGMGEHSIIQIAEALNSGIPVSDITYIPGTVVKAKNLEAFPDPVILPDFETVRDSKAAYAQSFALQYQNTDFATASPLAESYGSQGYVVQNPPAAPLTETEMDDVYDLPYMRAEHPMYRALGGIPAFGDIRYSLTSNRGCFGSCSFCALTFHEGRIVQTRSHESILSEARQMTEEKDFKGYIFDVGGPTADFRGPSCQKQLTRGTCKNRQCLFPAPCRNLQYTHKDYVKLLRELKEIPKVKKVFIRSGIRFDYCVNDPDPAFISELVKDHISGQLRVAPEHVSDKVLSCMGKPNHAVYQKFLAEFDRWNKKYGKEQYALPYFMSSHPGCGLKEAIELAEYIRDMDFIPEQAQDFYPTPSTLSTCMYYTGINPLTGEQVFVEKNPHEKAIQRALIQYRNPDNYDLVKEGLLKAHRQDLIGFGEKCLIRPRKEIGRGKKKDNPETKTANSHSQGSGRQENRSPERNRNPKRTGSPEKNGNRKPYSGSKSRKN